MKKIVIIEDEILCAKRLERLILDYDDSIEIVGPLNTLEKVEKFLSSDQAYDLIISDIRLERSTVFEAFELYIPKSFVIFTTAFNEYALNAFKANGIDYLLKPITYDNLSKALDKLKLYSPKTEHVDYLSYVAKDLHIWRTHLLVEKGDELITLNIKDISCFSSASRHLSVYTHTGEVYEPTINMSDLESSLNPDVFFRINRQYIANINYLEKISFHFHSKLHVRIKGCDDDNILISKERATKFKNWLNR